MQIRPATEADVDTMRRLWDEFTEEATFTPYPGNAFEPALVTNHIALVAEERGEAVGTVYTNVSSPHFGYVFGHAAGSPPPRHRAGPHALHRRRPPRRRTTSCSASIPRTKARGRSTRSSASSTRRGRSEPT